MQTQIKRFALYDSANSCHYKHFGINIQYTQMCCTESKYKDIKLVTLQISQNQERTESNDLIPDYWGWYDNEKQDFRMIYPKLFLLRMCFPYGLDIMEKQNKGKSYRLEIINIE